MTKNDRGDLNEILEKISKLPDVEELLNLKDNLLHIEDDLNFFKGGTFGEHTGIQNLADEKTELEEKLEKLEKKIYKISCHDYKLSQIVDILMKKDGSNCNLSDYITISEFLYSQFHKNFISEKYEDLFSGEHQYMSHKKNGTNMVDEFDGEVNFKRSDSLAKIIAKKQNPNLIRRKRGAKTRADFFLKGDKQHMTIFTIIWNKTKNNDRVTDIQKPKINFNAHLKKLL